MIRPKPERVRLRDNRRQKHLLKHPELAAAKLKIARQVEDFMEHQKLSKSQMATQMQTSRAQLNRLLDPNNPSITLLTIERAAAALGKRLRVEIY